jgi:hypothetical protein
MRGLPQEFHGVRTGDEVLRDLAAIADGDARLSVVTASVRTPGEAAARYDGPLRLDRALDEIAVIVGEERIARFHPAALRGGWLRTYDGDDYFDLHVDTGEKLLDLSD